MEGDLPLAEAHQIADRLEAAIRREFGAATEIEVHIEPLEPDVFDARDTEEEQRRSYAAALEEAARAIDSLSDVHNVRLRRSGRGAVLVAHCRLDPAATVESASTAASTISSASCAARKPDLARIVIHAEPAR